MKRLFSILALACFVFVLSAPVAEARPGGRVLRATGRVLSAPFRAARRTQSCGLGHRFRGRHSHCGSNGHCG